MEASPRMLRWETLTKTQFDEIDPTERGGRSHLLPHRGARSPSPAGRRRPRRRGPGGADAALPSRAPPEPHLPEAALPLRGDGRGAPARLPLLPAVHDRSRCSRIWGAPSLHRDSATCSSPASTVVPGTSSPSSGPARGEPTSRDANGLDLLPDHPPLHRGHLESRRRARRPARNRPRRSGRRHPRRNHRDLAASRPPRGLGRPRLQEPAEIHRRHLDSEPWRDSEARLDAAIRGACCRCSAPTAWRSQYFNVATYSGAPAGASAELGERILDTLAEKAAGACAELLDGETRPRGVALPALEAPLPVLEPAADSPHEPSARLPQRHRLSGAPLLDSRLAAKRIRRRARPAPASRRCFRRRSGKSPPVHDALASEARNSHEMGDVPHLLPAGSGLLGCQIGLPVRDHLLDIHAGRNVGGDHLGAARLGADRIHPDTELAELERRDPGHSPHRPFAGGVGDQTVLRREPVDGGDVDDGAGARLLHRSDRPP